MFPCSAVICIFPDTPTKRNLLCANMGCGGSKAEDGDAADHGDVVMVVAKQEVVTIAVRAAERWGVSVVEHARAAEPHERTGQAE